MVKKIEEGKKRHSVCYDTDAIAKFTWLSLLKDFRAFEGSDFCLAAERSFLSGIAEYRDYKYPELGIIPVDRFRRFKQLESLFKKYRFAKDKYTDRELLELTFTKYVREQEEFSLITPMKPLAVLVCRRARRIARRILGKYNPEETVLASRFGKKSSIGCPFNLAYIDHKLTDVKAFTGSSDCSKWFFQEVVPYDGILTELLRDLAKQRGFAGNFEHDSLHVIPVPKSWKALRPITPLTLIALYYSYGVGSQIEQRLRDYGLDIRRLQERHRRLVENFSISRSHATADLRSASQSLLCDLLNRVLPRDWYNAAKKSFTHQQEIGGVMHYVESVAPMGNGLTFPLETLVFYVILKALAELSKVRGLISVYGDDLIYPARLHRYVAVVFPLLKFRLNLDKTFVKAHFRESCGSDFYRGVDARPSFLPDGGQHLSRTQYATFLYKAINALRRRWTENEIPSTLLLLLTELAHIGVGLYRVPPSFPDTAGVKVSSPWETPMETYVFPWEPVKSIFRHGSRWFHFSYLTVTPNRRIVKSVLPYYWLALQGLDDELPPHDLWERLSLAKSPGLRFRMLRKIDPSLVSEAPRQPLEWKTQQLKRSSIGKDGKRHTHVKERVLVTASARRGETVSVARSYNSRDDTESMSDWF